MLVHGAGTGPGVWRGWEQALAGLAVEAVDLQRGLELSRASMADYAQAVVRAAGRLPAPVALCGFSMGGLVAMMAAAPAEASRLVVMEPSPPREVLAREPGAALRDGTFDVEEVYGRFPAGVDARPESLLARIERRRGIPVPSPRCPMLVVYGDSVPPERGPFVAERYGAEHLHVARAEHWDLVLEARVRAAVAAWLRGVRPPPRRPFGAAGG